MRDWLRDLRVSSNKTMKVVASDVGISECFYSQIENGDRNPSVKVAQSLGKLLGFSWTKFFE